MGIPTPAVARVNGQPLNAVTEVLDEAALRQRACSELLRQAAQDAGLLGVEERASGDGVLSQDASDAIERLLDLELRIPDPDEESCRRYHAGASGQFRRAERLRLRHILFAVTKGGDVAGLRSRAEHALLELRCDESDKLFGQRAQELSNCPSGSKGGELGWLLAADCAPEFARDIFGRDEVGVLPRIVHSRFGFHVVEVLERDGGAILPYEEVSAAIRLTLRQRSWATALRQYLATLAGRAQLEGVQLDASDGPLVQ